MTQRILVATAVGTAWLLAATAASAQAPPPAGDYTPPKTPWGEPDLQGTFSNRTITPMERSRDLGERVFFTPEEALALESRAQESSGDEERSVGTRGDVGCERLAAVRPTVAVHEAEIRRCNTVDEGHVAADDGLFYLPLECQHLGGRSAQFVAGTRLRACLGHAHGERKQDGEEASLEQHG
jgi:hypothetical protein